MPFARPRLAFLAALLLLSAGPPPAQAQPPDVMTLVRADRWEEAAAAAASEPDPVAAKLVTYYRLLAPGAASQAEIGLFMADSPDWPLQGTLARRRDQALAADVDNTDAATACAAGAADSAAALGRCAEASAALGHAADATAYARRAWAALPDDAAAEQAFLARWGAALGNADQVVRFDRLAWGDTAGAARQALRLPAADRARAEARLALRRDDPRALDLVQALPPAEQASPAMMLEQARYLRRADRDADALALWQASGSAAERAAPADHLAAFWDERNILARHRLRDGDPQGAYALAAGHAQKGSEQVADAEFLAGFIALRKLNDPARATRHFATLAGISKAAITQGRAHYWLARAATDPAVAKREYAAAAAYPNTFYGQLAALALGDGAAGLAQRISGARDPGWDAGQALAFAGRELARASAYLVAWGEPRRAQAFMLRLVDITLDPADRSMAAHLAAGFGMPETAVAVARKAGREGVALLDAGWPVAAEIPPDAGLPAALALGIIRQESSFDGTTVSPVGARGLMQLMPATAAQVAQTVGLRGALPSLTADTALNVRLGTAYLHGLMDQYDGCTPLAVAAYNAGPNRVAEWLANNGDPRAGATDMLDWIEQIPFGETRNYVQRVIENEVIYRAKQGSTEPHPLAPWLK
jgi:soluble lytic murein transglycosylase